MGDSDVNSRAQSRGGRRIMDCVRDALALRHYSDRTASAYLGWVRRFIMFHGRKHPLDLDASAVSTFLSSLATDKGVSASTQNQAMAPALGKNDPPSLRKTDPIGWWNESRCFGNGVTQSQRASGAVLMEAGNPSVGTEIGHRRRVGCK
jgi:hypothetical protein